MKCYSVSNWQAQQLYKLHLVWVIMCITRPSNRTVLSNDIPTE